MEEIDLMLRSYQKKDSKHFDQLQVLSYEAKYELLKMQAKKQELIERLFIWYARSKLSMSEEAKNLKLKDLIW